jgi:tRNA threonylcarbamoyladenosine biosynthesis protein TsaE
VIEIVRQCDSEDLTASLAAGLAAVLRHGDRLALRGDLGAGKTTFVRHLAAALGVPSGMVSSPTFVMANQYPARGGLELVHADF